MNDPSHQTELTDFDALLAAAADGSLDDAEHDALINRLADDPELRQRYIDYLLLHADLNWDRARLAPQIPVAASASRPAASSSSPVRGRLRSRGRIVGYVALAAAVALVASLTTLMFTRTSTPAPQLDKAPVALLSDMTDAIWGSSTVPTALGCDLPPGRLTLRSGTAQVLFRSGAVVDLEGPCQFEMTGPNTARLDRGAMHTFVPAPAHGFTVVTPDHHQVVDLGTQFWLDVRDGKALDVWVTQGHVMVVSPRGDQHMMHDGQRLTRNGPDAELVMNDYDVEPGRHSPLIDSPISIHDDFSVSALDPRRWRTLDPFGGSYVHIGGGAAEFAGRGYLITRDRFVRAGRTPGRVLRISGVWQADTSDDFLQIITRAIPQATGNDFGEIAGGLECQLRLDGDPTHHSPAIILGRDKVHVDGDHNSASVQVSPNGRYRFTVEDRGDIAVFIIGPDVAGIAPARVVAHVRDDGDGVGPIVIHNRQSDSDHPRTSRLLNVQIDYDKLPPLPADPKPGTHNSYTITASPSAKPTRADASPDTDGHHTATRTNGES